MSVFCSSILGIVTAAPAPIVAARGSTGTNRGSTDTNRGSIGSSCGVHPARAHVSDCTCDGYRGWR